MQELKYKIKRIIKDPKMQEAFLSMKPAKNIWGVAGVILFFFVPEITAYIW